MTIENPPGFFLLDVDALRQVASKLENASGPVTLTKDEIAVVLSALPTTEPLSPGED